MRYQHIMAATDFSELGDRAVQRAAELAIALGAKLTIVHVVPVASGGAFFPYYQVHDRLHERDEAQKAAVETLEGRVPKDVQEAGLEVRTEVRAGDPADVLVATIQELGADLVVLATNGRRGVRKMLIGSVTERVVRESHAMADVLVIS